MVTELRGINNPCYGKYGKDNPSYGKPKTLETRLKISKALTGGTSWIKGLTKETDERILKISKTRTGKPRSLETIAKMSAGLKGISHPQTQVTRNKIGATRKRLSIALPIEVRASIRATVTKLWKLPGYISKQMRARGCRPNKPELFLLELLDFYFPNQWKYTGDGKEEEFVVGSKVPDFTNISGQNQLIEHYGDYHHRGQNPQDRIDYFKKYGFECLVIWEHELQDPITLKEKIINFVEKPLCPIS